MVVLGCNWVELHSFPLRLRALMSPVLKRTLATSTPKMNPPTWAKNATPLSPVLVGWISELLPLKNW